MGSSTVVTAQLFMRPRIGCCDLIKIGTLLLLYYFDQVIYLFIQFVGHTSQGGGRGLTATNFGRCHTPPRRLTNMFFVAVAPENGSEILENNLVGSENANLVDKPFRQLFS
jgi:hypothetical protein